MTERTKWYAQDIRAGEVWTDVHAKSFLVVFADNYTIVTDALPQNARVVFTSHHANAVATWLKRPPTRKVWVGACGPNQRGAEARFFVTEREPQPMQPGDKVGNFGIQAIEIVDDRRESRYNPAARDAALFQKQE